MRLEHSAFSKCRTYRYTLYRRLPVSLLADDDARHRVVFVLANPSYANDTRNDLTTIKAMRFTTRLGGTDYLAVNCFALISTDPSGLYPHPDPVGPLNDAYIQAAAAWADRIVVAFGTIPLYQERYKDVLRLLEGYELLCLGRTKQGLPRHPLYLRGDTEFERYVWSESQ